MSAEAGFVKDAAVPSFGSNIKTTVKAPRKGKGGAAGTQGGNAPRGPAFERGVANCLCCGKIYSSRTVTNDLLEFLGEMFIRHSGPSASFRQDERSTNGT